MRLLKTIIVLVVLAFIGLAGFAYLGDLSPERGEINMPVPLDDG